MSTIEIMWFNSLKNPAKKNLFSSEYYQTVQKTGDELILIARDDPKMKKLFTAFNDYSLLYKYQSSLDLSDRNLYEMIPGDQKQKIHFDIDVTDMIGFVEEEFIDMLIDGIKKYIKVELDLSQDILIFTSHGKYKLSYHVIVNNYYLNDVNETRQFVKAILADYCKLNLFVDNKIYTMNRQFRLYGSCKIGDTSRIKKLMPEWKYKGQIIKCKYQDDEEIFINSLVSNTADCKDLDLFEITDSKTFTVEEDDTGLEDEVLIQIKKLFVKCFGTGIFFKFGTYKDGILTTKREKESFCKICNRRHQHENPFFTINKKTGQVRYCCRRSNALVDIGNIKIGNNIEEVIIPSEVVYLQDTEQEKESCESDNQDEIDKMINETLKYELYTSKLEEIEKLKKNRKEKGTLESNLKKKKVLSGMLLQK